MDVDEMDHVESSHNGDEFKATAIADARCTRCTEGDDTYALLVSGMDEALLKLSRGLLFESRQTMLEAYKDLMDVRQAIAESAA